MVSIFPKEFSLISAFYSSQKIISVVLFFISLFFSSYSSSIYLSQKFC
jgi:hypothetical protein